MSPTNAMPVIYLPHGGGPWPFVDMFDAREVQPLLAYLRSLDAQLPVRPTALVVISAHWEAAVPTVLSGARPPLLFEYHGFPPSTYQLTWPASGRPALAARVVQLLEAAGIREAVDGERGFDHGTFIPLKIAYQDAAVPTIQISLKTGLDLGEHLSIGRALAPLRAEGVLLVGSGMSYHNVRGFGGVGRVSSETFDAWLDAAVTSEPSERDRRLTAWAHAPAARDAHPREEHLLPLMVIAGAAGADRGRNAYRGTFGDTVISAVHFGQQSPRSRPSAP